MLSVEVPWERRVTFVVNVASWIALAVGIVAATAASGGSATNLNRVLGATGVGSVWVLASTVIPLAAIKRSFVLEALAIVGSVSTMVAVAITGTVESPFLLLSLTPTMFAAIHGGFRVALATAALSSVLLAMVTFAQFDRLLSSGPAVALYFAVGVTIAQIRRLLLDLQRRADALSQSSLASEQRLHTLEGAHTLLERLAEITASSDTSPLVMGRTALETVCSGYPDSSAVAAILGDDGPIVVARHGVSPEPSVDTTIPLRIGASEVGFVRLKTPKALDRNEVASLETALRPLGLAFSNARLLQAITGNAVKAERVRLARELHDEIGPGLASLGLALDLALVQGSSQAELTEHIEQLRGKVGELVDEVRATVSDLRAPRAPSLKSLIDRLTSEMKPTARILYEIDERKPVRPSLSSAVLGVVGEAFRNAIIHADAAVVRFSGWVDFDRGKVAVEDDGKGFDPTRLPSGHFGVAGMRERAQEAGITLDIVSGQDGTRVLIEWS